MPRGRGCRGLGVWFGILVGVVGMRWGKKTVTLWRLAHVFFHVLGSQSSEERFGRLQPHA